MQSFLFSKFSPAGNTTIFLHSGNDSPLREYYCRVALGHDSLCAEQAAFANTEEHYFIMGGGEFCVNACRAFGALLDCAASTNPPTPAARTFEINASGWPEKIPLLVRGQQPYWQVAAGLNLSNCSMESLDNDQYLVHMPGISHLLSGCNTFPTVDEALQQGPTMAKNCGICNCQAYGSVWWRKASDDLLEILPFVHVEKSDTSTIEKSCGSASLALSMVIASRAGKEKLKILQPGGDILEIFIPEPANPEKLAYVEGPVTLIAQGTIWLPLPDELYSSSHESGRM